jgi:hypothetical protein
VVANMKERTPHRAFARPRQRAIHGRHALAPFDGDFDLLRHARAKSEGR